MPEAAASRGGGAEACVLDAVYTFGLVGGGMVESRDESRLEPPDTYRVTRSFLFEREDASCTTTIPACGSPGAIDVADLRAALEHPDVTSAWGDPRTALYGADFRPVDLGLWFIRKGPDPTASEWILLGERCEDHPSCRAIPDGLLALEDVMERLREQEAGKAACESLRRPG